MAELLKALTKEDFQHSFDQWKKRMERPGAIRGTESRTKEIRVEGYDDVCRVRVLPVYCDAGYVAAAASLSDEVHLDFWGLRL
ncbi:Hypothetical protein CINCED_3A010215 [Cinara cedri]|uniref:Uncharacterized protein n=1 Tax=Cinara cedri TaxID=506608 RepID=A0A5E4MB15_9HEMI|nr:Hypothetical protein CINCED_3A010215 [Cinara cedri]